VNPLFALLLAGAVLGLLPRLHPNALPQPSARHENDTVCGARSLSPSGAVREAWIARYGGYGWDVAFAIRVDGSGNSYVTGTSADDYATIKYSPVGQELWVARYDGAGDVDGAKAIAVDGAGNVYVTGQSYTSFTQGFSDFATIKYNTAGQEQWVARYGDPVGRYGAAAITVDDSSNVYVTGTSGGDYVTVKYNSAGAEQWVARYGNEAAAIGVAVDGAGNVYVTGTSYQGGSDCCDYATIKYNSAGQEQWVAVYDSGPADGQDEAYAIAVDSLGNVYVTGGSATGPQPPSTVDYATVKYNSAGQEQWVARYNGPGDGDDQANAIAIDSSDNVYVTGGSDADYATIKYNPAGGEEWVVLYSGPGNGGDAAQAIAIDGSDDVYVTGTSAGGSATIKYNAAGQEQWVARYEGAVAEDIAVDGSGNVYVTGWGDDAPYADYVTIKYVQGPRPRPRPSPHPRP
jgi:Beta-propeller repeat